MAEQSCSSPLTRRLGITDGEPLTRTDSGSSAVSLNELEALDVGEEISRISSPVLTFADQKQPEEPTFELATAADRVRDWWIGIRRIRRAARGLCKDEVVDAGRRLVGAPAEEEPEPLLKRLKEAATTESAIQLTSSRTAAADATALLLAMPRDKALNELGRSDIHGPRAFLAALLIAACPSSVLGDDHDSPAGRAVSNASRMLVLSLQRLVEVLVELRESSPSPEQGASGSLLRRFRERLVMVRWTRRYHATAFRTWQIMDSQRVASQLLGPYAECFAAVLDASRTKDDALMAAAQRQLGELRQALVTLMGPSAASSKLQEVEAAVTGQMQRAQSYVAQTRGSQTKEAAAPPSAAVAGGQRVNNTAGEQAEDAQAKKLSLKDLLVNEQLAHELILDPSFQLDPAPEPESFTAPIPRSVADIKKHRGQEELSSRDFQRRLQSTVEDIFWHRLVLSLTPATQTCREEFVLGSRVQARFGGTNGSFYEAEVTQVRDDGTFDIIYPEDKTIEKGVPLSNLRMASDPVDPRPLLGLLNDVRKRLEDLTPRRSDLHATYRAALDEPFLQQMVLHGSLDWQAILNLFNFLLDSVQRLESPVRAERTQEWKDAFNAHLVALAPGAAEASAAGTSSVAIVLPTFFKFVFSAMDQIQRDIVNTQLTMLSPHLRGEAGVVYERERFDAKVQQGLVSLQRTKSWLQTHLGTWLQQAGPGGEENPDAKSRRDGLMAGTNRSLIRACIADAFLALIQAPARLNSPEGLKTVPETLEWDAGRLARVRDMMDRVVLTASLLVLLRQCTAARRVVPTDAVLGELQRKLDWLLQQPDTRLDSLQRAVVDAAQQAGREATGHPLPDSDIDTLAHLVASAADPQNTIFSLFTRRAYLILRTLILVRPCFAQAQNSTSGSNHSGAASSGLTAALDGVIGPTGLEPFRNLLLAAGTAMHGLFSHNLAAYCPHYSMLLSEIASSLP